MNKQQASLITTSSNYKDYLKYFGYKKDGNDSYLIKRVKIRTDSDIFDLTQLGVQAKYNIGFTELESYGLKFKPIIKDGKTICHHLIMDKTAKDVLADSYLCIDIIDGKMSELLLVNFCGIPFSNLNDFDSLDEDGKAFIQELLKSGLLVIK